ncbi:MAG: hypothetical protein AAF623_00505 [Planctomycetota bacterium]
MRKALAGGRDIAVVVIGSPVQGFGQVGGHDGLWQARLVDYQAAGGLVVFQPQVLPALLGAKMFVPFGNFIIKKKPRIKFGARLFFQ